jgi:hypothetical protein
MMVVNGVFMITIGLLLFGIAIVVMRNPRKSDLPDWVTGGAVQIAVTLVFMTLAVWGVSDLMVVGTEYGKHPTQAPINLIEAGIIVANVVAFVVLWKRLGVRRRLAQYEAMSAAAPVVQPKPGPNGGDDNPVKPSTPGGVEPPRKRAA